MGKKRTNKRKNKSSYKKRKYTKKRGHSGGSSTTTQYNTTIIDMETTSDNPLTFEDRKLLNPTYPIPTQETENKLIYIKDGNKVKPVKYKRLYEGHQKYVQSDNNVYVFKEDGFIPFPETYVLLIYEINRHTGNQIKNFQLTHKFSDQPVQEISKAHFNPPHDENTVFPPDITINEHSIVNRNRLEKQITEKQPSSSGSRSSNSSSSSNNSNNSNNSFSMYSYAYKIFNREANEKGYYMCLNWDKDNGYWKWETIEN